jgi:hypothetical protein
MLQVVGGEGRVDDLLRLRTTKAAFAENSRVFEDVAFVIGGGVRVGAADADIEPYLRVALKRMLKDRITRMERLHRAIK